MTRQTWASSDFGGIWPRQNVTMKTKLVFVLGQSNTSSNEKIQEEANTYKDILQGLYLQRLKVMIGRENVIAL